MGERAKIYQEVMGARIKDIQMPDEFTYNHDRLAESSRVKNNTISIILDNGEILLVGGYIRICDERIKLGGKGVMGSETKEKDTYKYHLKLGRKVVHKDICTDWVSRGVFHQEEFPGSRIKLIGRRTTREAALKWVHRGGRRGYRLRGGKG